MGDRKESNAVTRQKRTSSVPEDDDYGRVWLGRGCEKHKPDRSAGEISNSSGERIRLSQGIAAAAVIPMSYEKRM